MEEALALDAGICVLRPWRETDIERLAELANNEDVARYMADRFPHPYTIDDARYWITLNLGSTMLNNFAIEVDRELAGGIGMDPLEGERRVGAQFGYWLARAYWGRGIATAACAAFTEYAMHHRGFVRLEATVYAPNVASMRVLEKCAFTREGIMRSAVIKGGEVFDAYLYAKVQEH